MSGFDVLSNVTVGGDKVRDRRNSEIHEYPVSGAGFGLSTGHATCDRSLPRALRPSLSANPYLLASYGNPVQVLNVSTRRLHNCPASRTKLSLYKLATANGRSSGIYC
jgi:hypothetical protein